MTNVQPRTIELAWQPEKADYREMALVCRRQLRQVVFGSLVGIGALSLVIGLAGHSPSLVGWGVGLLVYGVVLGLYAHRNAGNGFWKHDFLRSPKQATLSATGGVELRSAESTGTYTWAAFATAQETERMFVLRLRRGGTKPGAFILLPKRGFATPGDIEEARTLLRHQVVGGVRPI